MPSEPGSAERLTAIPARSFPRTFSAGLPYAVLSSTPGKASPIFRTVSKSIALLGIGQRDSMEFALFTWLCEDMDISPSDAVEIILENRNPFKVSRVTGQVAPSLE